MDVSSPCENSVSEYISTLHDLYQSPGDHKRCTFSTSEDYVAAELGRALSEVLNFQDAHDLVPDGVPASYWNKTSQMEKGKVCDDLKTRLASLSTATIPLGLSRSATYPCSKTEMLDKGSHEQNEYSACIRSQFLPVPLKPVSAMKGGREKQGIPHTKLTVTWAHDVYDPPVTSLSHSVKGGYSQHRSSRSNKKSSSSSSKHKHKGKSSRGSNSDNYKKQYRKHIGHSESRTRSAATKDRLVPLNDINQKTVELSDFTIAAGQDTKCGNSYFMKSFTELHLPVAEA